MRNPHEPRNQQSLTRAESDVLWERRRQQVGEGWTEEHDDGHRTGDLAIAAARYALSSVGHPDKIADMWCWHDSWFKPSNARRDLVKAGALILAEIERLDRADAVKADAPKAEGSRAAASVHIPISK